METQAILVAAGRGERMGAARPKAFLSLAGQTLLERSARALGAAPSVSALVAVVPEDAIAEARELCGTLAKPCVVVAGGARRQDSVRAGLDALPSAFDGVVLVHDAARPLVSVEVVEAVVRAAREHGAAIPVVPVADTIKEVGAGRVAATVDRERLAAAQTPQGFRRDVLARAYEKAFADGVLVTDESMAVERLGLPVACVPGSTRNRKLTTPDDLAWAERVLGAGARA
jgi:2-C-methyl-D-erythritol 4-phosphate cytidylyltransferase